MVLKKKVSLFADTIVLILALLAIASLGIVSIISENWFVSGFFFLFFALLMYTYFENVLWFFPQMISRYIFTEDKLIIKTFFRTKEYEYKKLGFKFHYNVVAAWGGPDYYGMSTENTYTNELTIELPGSPKCIKLWTIHYKNLHDIMQLKTIKQRIKY
jgi:hypothetical protein